ncbi:MAG: HDOD domain-containing protein [Desulfotalea sp.]
MSEKLSLIDAVNNCVNSGNIEIPVFSNTAMRVQQELTKQEPNTQKIEKIISSDQSLSGQILKTANSSFYSGLVEILTVKSAIVRLGIQEVGRIALIASSRNKFQSKNIAIDEMMKNLWQHSVGTALGAYWIAKKCKYDELMGHAFFAGLLHDVGKLLVLVVLEKIKYQNPTIDLNDSLIQEAMTSLHCEQGYSLMKKWNMPTQYCTTVRDHHNEEIDTKNIILLIVRLSDMVCRKVGIGTVLETEILPSSTIEAKVLNLSEIDLAELEIVLEDTAVLAK